MESDVKLNLNAENLGVTSSDFISALNSHPSSTMRSAPIGPTSKPLTKQLEPLLNDTLIPLQKILKNIFPCIDPQDEQLNFDLHISVNNFIQNFNTRFSRQCFRPRILICGSKDSGQIHIGSALLHYAQEIPYYSIDVPVLVSNMSCRTLEEALIYQLKEATRKVLIKLF